MGKWNHLYALPVWRQIRKAHLRSNPLCVKCEEQGLHVPGNTVDHRIPHRGDMDLFLDTSNLDTLCPTCHSSTKQLEERYGYAPGADESGQPLDERHPWFGGSTRRVHAPEGFTHQKSSRTRRVQKGGGGG